MVCRRKCKNIILLAIGIISLFIGGLIYLLFRTRNLIMFLFIPSAISDWFGKVSLFLDWNIPDWVNYSLPDGLFSISYICIMSALWSDNHKTKKVWVLSLPISLILGELLQLFNLAPGTFDYIDLIFFSAPVIVTLILHIYEKL